MKIEEKTKGLRVEKISGKVELSREIEIEVTLKKIEEYTDKIKEQRLNLQTTLLIKFRDYCKEQKAKAKEKGGE